MNLDVVAEKLKVMAAKIETDRGPLDLLGLFLREHPLGLWDLVIAGARLKSVGLESYKYVAGQVREALTDEEMMGLSRIVILDHGEEVLDAFLERFTNQRGLADVHFETPGGAIIRRAYVILARPAVGGRRQKAKK
jgi:hypothetical protein